MFTARRAVPRRLEVERSTIKKNALMSNFYSIVGVGINERLVGLCHKHEVVHDAINLIGGKHTTIAVNVIFLNDVAWRLDTGLSL